MTQTGKTWEEIKHIRECNVFFVGETVYVVASSRTVPGFTVDSEPILKIRRNDSPSDLGEAVLTALDSFRYDVEAPDFRVYRSPLLGQTGFRSWKQLEKNALCVHVHLDGGIFVTPTARDSKQGGYGHRPNLACECSTNMLDIGTTVLKAAALCT